MQTSKFTLIPPEIKPGDLLPALETVIPSETIEQANCWQQRFAPNSRVGNDLIEVMALSFNHSPLPFLNLLNQLLSC